MSEQTPEAKPCPDCLPEFDEEAAKNLSSHEIRRRWPRFDGKCATCGYEGIRYASFAQYVYGDY